MRQPKHLTFAAGEKQCEICGEDLPAITCRPQRTHFYCNTPACRKAYRLNTCFQEIAPNTKRCAGPNCQNFVPGGKYHYLRRFFHCSKECRQRFWRQGSKVITCALPGCGKQVRRKRRARTKNYFCCSAHNLEYRSQRIITKRAGRFLLLLNEYIATFATQHYRKVNGVRSALACFFEFLNEKGIEDLDAVTPKTISAFAACQAHQGVTTSNGLACVSTFFHWLIDEERRKHANPVVPRIHYVKRPKLLPRPYSEAEIAQIWASLEKRGGTRLKLAQAIAEEAGLRCGEICNLRLSDVNQKRQTLFVRLPNKTNEERMVLFHEKTKKYLPLWLKERSRHCGHDHLLHNSLGRPFSSGTLYQQFCRVLCKTALGKTVNADGLDSFSLHRSRHLMATRMAAGGADANAIMRQGGWRTASAMCGYARISDERAVRSYNEAMDRAAQNRTAPRTKTTNFKAFVQGVDSVLQRQVDQEDRERCA